MITMLPTFSGKRINLFNIQRQDICIEDIAHALALVNRFGGHTKEPISVAQHSYFVSQLCAPVHALQGLLHDAAEAYVGDMTKWLKESAEMAGFRAVEERVQRACYTALGVHHADYRHYASLKEPSVEAADRLMVRFEALWSYGDQMPLFLERPDYPVPTPEEITRVGLWKPWNWQHAEDMFLTRYEELR